LISGEQDPVLGSGQANELMVIQGRVKEGIIAQDAQPLGDMAKHCIGDK
jgi:hypothetical protein